MILRRKITWLCAALLIMSIGASLTINKLAYNFCASGDLAANWLCNYATTPQIRVDYVPTPQPPEINGTAVVTTKTQTISLPRPWNGKERVNILVMGIDQRHGEKDVAFRTDTMIVLTLDPVTLQAGMLSIPRDLWVPFLGYDNGRINTANFLGDAYAYPGGGSELARKTVEQLLGVPINFYARVNFTAFEEFIDQIGGITIDVPEDVYDPEYPTEDYRTEVFSITKGVHTMDGATALKFARTRHSLSNGDFDRARNQQLVLLGVKEKLSNPQVLVSLLAKAPEIISKLTASVKTDLTLDQAQQLAALAQKVDRKNIKTAVLDQTYSEFATTLTNPPQMVQVPIRSKMAQLRDSFFSTTPNAAVETGTGSAVSTASAPVSDTLPLEGWQGEKAHIAILNGTSTAGFEQQIGDALSAKGFNVVRLGNSPDGRADYDHTSITDYGGKQLTLDALTHALDISPTVKRVLDPNAREDIVIILGSDVHLP
jgi:LCP family protein required for cell wall assembly